MAVSVGTTQTTDPVGDSGYVVTLQRGSRDVVDTMIPEWTALCAEGPCDEPFYSPGWVLAYLAAFAPRASLTLITVRLSGVLRAVLPLTERPLGVGPLRLRLLQSAANVHFPRFDVIHGLGDQEAVTHALWEFLQNWSGWDLLQFESAPQGGIAWDLLELASDAGHATRLHQPDASPYVDVTQFPRGIDAIISTRSSNVRSQLRRSLKRLRAMGDIEFRLIGSGNSREEIQAAVDALYRQEASGWKGEANSAILNTPATKRFYDMVIADARDNGSLAISQLRCGDTLVATDLMLRSGNTMYELKTTYDEEYRTCSPGHVIRAHTLDTAPDLEVTVLDNCGRSAQHKLAWTSLSRPFATCFLFNRNIRGKLAWTAIFKVALPARRRLATLQLPRFVKRLVR